MTQAHILNPRLKPVEFKIVLISPKRWKNFRPKETSLLTVFGLNTVASGVASESDINGTYSVFLLYSVGVSGEMLLLTAIYFVMSVGRLSLRHALIGGATATILWEVMRHVHTTMSQIQLVYGSLTTAIAVLLR